MEKAIQQISDSAIRQRMLTVNELRGLGLGDQLDIWPIDEISEHVCRVANSHGPATIWLTCGDEDQRLCAICGINAVKARRGSFSLLTVDVLLAPQ